MRRFLAQLGAFLAVQVAIAVVVVSAYQVEPRSYLAATLDKHARLASLPPGRVVFVGGSNLAFGMDSPRVSDALGRPVVNLGLHAALGLPFILAEATAVAREGDVLVLSIEYEHFEADITSDFVFDVLEQRPASLAYLDVRHYPIILDRSLAYIGRVVHRAWRRIRGRPREHMVAPYAQSSFNEHGDVVAHLEAGLQEGGGASIGGKPWQPRLLRPVIAQLNEFHATIQRSNVLVLFSYPPISEAAHREVAGACRRLHTAMIESCTIPVLDSPATTWLPLDCFYDTSYHLNGNGVRQRLDRLLPLLRGKIR